jgi:Tol biopolymer transport system component
VTNESEVTLLSLTTAGGLSPRIQPGSIVYRGQKAGKDGLWKLVDGGAATELWNGVNGRVVAGPDIAHDGRLAFLVQRRGRTELIVMNGDGAAPRRLAEELDVRGAPAWSPDGRWLAVAAANADGQPQLFKIPVAGGPPVSLVKEYSTDPIWDPSGTFLLYSGADVGTTFPVKAVSADGAPWPLRDLILTRGARRLAFLGEDAVIIMKGDISHKDFWSLDLKTGRERQLTNLARGYTIGDFDISPDGREIVFDRVREQSNIVLFDLPAR